MPYGLDKLECAKLIFENLNSLDELTHHEQQAAQAWFDILNKSLTNLSFEGLDFDVFKNDKNVAAVCRSLGPLLVAPLTENSVLKERLEKAEKQLAEAIANLTQKS